MQGGQISEILSVKFSEFSHWMLALKTKKGEKEQNCNLFCQGVLHVNNSHYDMVFKNLYKKPMSFLTVKAKCTELN